MRRLLIPRQVQKERCVFNNFTDIISTVIRGGEGSDPINISVSMKRRLGIAQTTGLSLGGHLHPSDGSLELITTV